MEGSGNRIVDCVQLATLRGISLGCARWQVWVGEIPHTGFRLGLRHPALGDVGADWVSQIPARRLGSSALGLFVACVRWADWVAQVPTRRLRSAARSGVGAGGHRSDWVAQVPAGGLGTASLGLVGGGGHLCHGRDWGVRGEVKLRVPERASCDAKLIVCVGMIVRV